MEVRAFAERLLFGETLADKRFDTAELTDQKPGSSIVAPELPGRPADLAMRSGAEPFPEDLEDPVARGRALHFFANHELLAIELMALALLRFPDAPAAFRRGLVGTIRDEQRHLGMYVARMESLGTSFGDVGVGGFFWRTLSRVSDPKGFVAHMSLTFEQANLDHALAYAGLFERIGDAETAAVMRAVYEDEIRHVRFGAQWLRRFAPDAPLLDAHRDALEPPVSLRRARGRAFDREGRLSAGLDAEYVDAIENAPRTRGRAPVVHLFDPTAELELAHGSDYTPDAALLRRIEDLETVPMFYASPDDVVLVRREPRPAFLATLRAAGFDLPEFVVGDVHHREITAVAPWGWSPSIARRVAALRKRARQDEVPPQGWPRTTFSKAHANAALKRLPTFSDELGVVCSGSDVVDAAIEALRAGGFDVVAIKALYGTAGRGTIRVPPGPMTQPQRGFVDRTLRHQGGVIVEPWFSRVCDLSLRIEIDAPGQARILGLGRVLVDARGQYRGAVLGRATAGVEPEVARFLHEVEPIWRDVARETAAALAPTGYVGPVGVDAFVHRTRAGALRLRPIVEFNPRFHMGHVAHHLAKHIAPGTPATWRLVPATTEIPATNVRLHRGRIVEGTLSTNDPTRAREVIGLLEVRRK